MAYLPRKKIAPGDASPYESLGSLIKDYRLWREMSQEALAESIGISVRSLQNWEANRHSARIENLHDLAEFTGIPMQVCVALNARQPLWYSLQKRRFAYSSIEEELYSSHELLKYYAKSNDWMLTKYASITSDKHISMIIARHREIYGKENLLKRDLIKAASRVLPDLNRVILDSWGHYVGHMVCLPIKKNVYEEIKKRRVFEGYLTTQNISDIVALQEGVFFAYSFFAASANIGYHSYVSSLKYFTAIEQKGKYLIAAFLVPVEGKELFINVGMKVVGPCKDNYSESDPAIFEIELDKLMNTLGPMEALQWMMGKRRRGDGKAMSNTDPLNADDPFTADIPLLVKKHLPFLKSVSIDRSNRDNRERLAIKQQNKLTRSACSNSICSLHGQTATRNIVYNGTYRTKEGALVQRFLCKECGKSFCSRVNGIFYGLRTPEERVLQALDLLAKGMSMRGVGRTLGVKLDTVRNWLKIVEQHRK